MGVGARRGEVRRGVAGSGWNGSWCGAAMLVVVVVVVLVVMVVVVVVVVVLVISCIVNYAFGEHHSGVIDFKMWPVEDWKACGAYRCFNINK